MHSLMRNQIRHVQPLRKCMCVPELMTNKANELAAWHAYPFLYSTASLVPWTHKQSCLSSPLNPETTAVLLGCQQDESVLRREHRLTPCSDWRCNTFFFNGTSCCIELHQINCSASGRLCLRCLIFCEKCSDRASGICSLKAKMENGLRQENAVRVCCKIAFSHIFHHVVLMCYWKVKAGAG